MPLTAKGEKIRSAMEKEYGTEKGKEVFYASKNAGKISGVDAAADDCDLNSQIESRWDEAQADGYVRIIDSVMKSCDDLERRMDAAHTNKGKHFHAHTHIPRGGRIAGRVKLR